MPYDDESKRILAKYGITYSDDGQAQRRETEAAPAASQSQGVDMRTLRNTRYDTESRRILAKYGIADYTQDEIDEMKRWSGIAKRGYGNLSGYVNQLGKTDWTALNYDKNYRQGLGQQIQEAQDYFKSLKKDSISYKDAKDYLDYLTGLQSAFKDREGYLANFKDEQDYKDWQASNDYFTRYAGMEGISYDDIYQHTVNDADVAKERFDKATADSAQLQKDLVQLRNYYQSAGQVLADGKLLRGAEAEAYIARKRAELSEAQQQEQQAAAELQSAQRVSAYARARRYEDLPDMPDWNEKIRAGREAYEGLQNPGYSPNVMATDPLAMAFDQWLQSKENEAAEMERPKTGTDQGWTEDELNTYFYLNADNKEAAADYAWNLNAARRLRDLEAQQKKIADWTNESGWNRAAAWGAGVLSMPFQSADYLDAALGYAVSGRIAPHENMTPADYANTMTGAAAQYLNENYRTIGEDVPIIGGAGLGDVYQLSQSIAQSALAASMGGGTANLLFFGSAANQGLADAKARGASDGEALVLGFLNGAAEVLGETFSVEKLIAIRNPATFRRYLWNVVKQGGVEASEEAFTTVLNTFADAIVMGDKSEISTKIQDLMAQGLTRAEAERKAWQEWTEGVAYDALGGLLSGGISAAGRQGIGMLQAGSFAYSGADAEQLVEAGLQKNKNSAAYKLAQQIQEQGTMSELEAQRLTDLLGEDAEAIHRNQRAELKQEAQRRLQESGMDQRSAARMAETVTRDLLGEKLDRTGKADRERDFQNPTVRTVAEQLRQERRLESISRWQQAQANRSEKKTAGNISEQLKKAFSASNLEISDKDLEILQEGYGGGQRMNAYVIAMRDGYRLGKVGMDYEKAAAASEYSRKVLPLQFQHAWELGMKAGGREIPSSMRGQTAELGSAEKTGSVTLRGQEGAYQIQSLQRNEAGELQATVKAEDGSEQSVSVKSLDFADSGMGDLVQVLRDRPDAEQMFQAYRSGTNIGSFVRAWDTAKAYGQATGSRTVESVLQDSMLKGMDEDTIRTAFAYGRSLKEQQKAARAKEKETATSSVTAEAATPSPQGEGLRGEGKGGVSYDGGTVGSIQLKAVNKNRLTPKQRAQIRVVEALGKQFGIKFVLFQSEMKSGRYKGFNGLEQNGVIYLDVNAGMYGKNLGQIAIVRTAAHELTHWMREFNEERYEELQEFLLDNLEEWKGRDLGQLVAQKMLRAKNSELDAEGALEEVVADGCEMMLSRTKVLQNMAEEKPGLLQAVRDWLQGFMDDLKEAFQGVSALHEEARAVESWEQEKLEKFTEIWYKGLTEAAERAAQGKPGSAAKRQEEQANRVGVSIDAETESVNPKFSEKTWMESDYVTARKEAAKAIADALGISQKKALAYIDSVNSVARTIADERVRLDYEDTGLSPFVSNAEYGGSFDFTTLCKKRRLLTGTFSAIQNALPNTALTANQILEIRKMMDDAGLEVNCGKCYVEGSRASMGIFTKEFIELYKKYYPGKWAPNMAQMNTPDGIEWVRNNHQEVYEQYEYFWNHYGTLRQGDPNLFASQQKPKLYQMRSAYKGEVLQHFKGDGKIEEKNRNGGMRMQSFSDFEIVHLIDAMQVIMDMSRVGLAGQAYTKVPDFAWALGQTGLKINLSIDAWDVVDGKLVFNNKEGMNFDEAMRIREANSKNVGTICCVYDDQQLLAALADDRIDFIIPFHRSQWKKSQYKGMGLPATTKDYTYQQNEKWLDPSKHTHEFRGRQVRDKCSNFMPNEYWDFSKSGKENAEKYLQMCAEAGKRPKFYKFLTNNGDGSFSLKADGSTDGYWKLLIDFKMYDNDGVGSPQMPVRPDFNMKEIQRMLTSYEGGHNRFPVAQGVVDQFVSQYKAEHKGMKFQEREEFDRSEVNSALWDAYGEADKGQNNLIRVGSMPEIVKYISGIDGDLYIYRNHSFENMVSAEEAEMLGRYNKDAHYHNLGIERMTDAVMSLANPLLSFSTWSREGNPTIIMLLPVKGNNNAPLYAVLSFYSNRDINGRFEKKPHIVLTIAERGYENEGSRAGLNQLVEKAVKEDRILSIAQKNREDLSVITKATSLSNVTESSLIKNISQFKKIVNKFKQENDINYQEREDLPDDRALLMQARAEGRNAESLTAYQKKVKTLEALERKLRRQQDALEAARKHEAVDEKGEPLPPEEQKKFNREAVKGVQEQIRKTEASIRRAEQALAEMERKPELRQELEKSLARWREQNPNDAAKAIREMQQERDSLREYVKLLQKEAKLTTPEERKVLPSDVQKLARSLVKEHGSEAAVDQIAAMLQDMGDFMVSNMQGGGTGYYNALVNKAKQIAKAIIDESYETIDENKEVREGIRAYLREHTLRISDDVKGDIPDFERWRKAHMGTLRMGREGMDIDQAYQDLRSSYGEGFFPADVLSHSDQLQQILDTLEAVQPTYQQMFSQFESWQAAESFANEIIDRMLSGEVREKESMADQAFRRRMEQLEKKYERKDRARQKALENAEDRAAWEARKRDESEERRLEERALRRQLVAEKVHELRERSIERDRKYRGRIAIDKKVTSLSKIMLENSGKRHVPDAWKEAIGNFLASIDTLTQHSGEGSRSFHLERIENLKAMVEKQQLANEGREARSEEQGPQVFLDINPYLADMLKPFVAMARDSSTGTIQVENLEVEQMKELEEVLTAIREAVDKSDVMLAAAEKGETLSKTAGETIRHLESLGKGKTGTTLRRFLSWDNLTPVFFFKRFGAGGERVFRELQRGWGKLAMNAKQIIDFSNATYTAKEARAWEQEVHEFKLIRRESDLSGRESLTKAAAEGGAEAAKEAEERNKETVKLSTAQIMGLYCLVKREQALGHILGGGIRIWDITAKPTLKDRITGENVQEQAERYLVDEEDIAKITGTLTARQKEVADKLQRYMNTVGSTWGNEVSQARYGVDLFGEKNYYPIVTDPKSRNARTPDADGSDLYHILNMGFTKTPEKNARNGIVIHSIFDVFSNHMADMAKYNSMGLPMLDAMKWFNYLDETDNSFTSVRGAMERALGKNAELYFMGLIQDLNGNFEGGRRGEDIASKMISFSKVASVGANLRVAALQPTSYVRALAVLDPKYLLKGDNPTKIRQGIREALQYSGTAVWKDLGFFDLNINANMRDMIKHTDGALEKVREKSMWGAEMGDKTTWGRLWNATKAEVQDKTGLTGEALLKATAERFDDVIYQTQVMDSTMTRSHLMRQKGAFASMMTSFMSEPTLSYNLLLDAVSKWQQDKRSGQGMKAAGKLAARAFTTYALSQIAASIVESIFSAMRDDDDYESFWEKWKQAEFGGDGNLVQDLLLHNKLPYVRDVVSILEGWTNKRMDTEWVEDLTRAYKALKRDLENGEIRWGTAYACMTALSTVTGLPIANTARDGVALWNTFVVANAPDWKLKTVKRGTVKPLSGIKQAYQAGAISEEDAIRYLMRDAEIETEEKAKQTIFEWGLEKGEKKYDALLAAVRDGQSSAEARDELLQAGFSEDALASAVKTAVKEWYQGTAEDGRPRIDKETAIRMLVSEGGMNRRDAEAKVREWSSYVSSPEKLQYEDIQDAYIAGEITAARAAEMRMLYGGKSKSEAQTEVLKWTCEKDTGIAYNDLKDAWLDGEISDEEAVAYQMKYGGTTKVKAEKTMQQWRYAKDTGGDYSDVKQGFLEGELSAEEAIAARVDYGGQTRTDAQKEIRKWSCEKETGMAYDDLQDLYVSGELSAERAIQLRQTYGGQTKLDAEAEIRKWKCEKETGIHYDSIQDLYLSGELSGQRAAKLRQTYGGKSQEDAEKEIRHWTCEKETGVKYDDIREAFAGGQITADKAQKMLEKYGGYDEKDAEAKVLQYKFAGTNADLADITPSAATTWYGSLESQGISKEIWYKTWRTNSTTTADKYANGKTISGSKKNKMVAYINGLNLTPAQKDALYLALDYAKSGLRATPWH